MLFCVVSRLQESKNCFVLSKWNDRNAWDAKGTYFASTTTLRVKWSKIWTLLTTGPGTKRFQTRVTFEQHPVKFHTWSMNSPQVHGDWKDFSVDLLVYDRSFSSSSVFICCLSHYATYFCILLEKWGCSPRGTSVTRPEYSMLDLGDSFGLLHCGSSTTYFQTYRSALLQKGQLRVGSLWMTLTFK